MQKSKLGISIGALGAITYFAALFGGYLPVLVLAGYILLREENAWLRRSAVKAVAILALFSVCLALLNLIPEALGVIKDFLNLFNGKLDYGKLGQIISLLTGIVGIFEKVLFLGLGIKALKQSVINVPVIDSMVNRFFE